MLRRGDQHPRRCREPTPRSKTSSRGAAQDRRPRNSPRPSASSVWQQHAPHTDHADRRRGEDAEPRRGPRRDTCSSAPGCAVAAGAPGLPSDTHGGLIA